MNITDFENDLKDKNHNCIICGASCKNRSVLGWHLRDHAITTKEYVFQHYYNSEVPTCSCGCEAPVSWDKAKYKFRDFVTGHNRTGFRKPKTEIKKRAYSHKLGHFSCALCEFETDKMKSLTSHAQRLHGLGAAQYTIDHVYGGVQPVCKKDGCQNVPRYSQMKFKAFCSEHAALAAAAGGRKGGQAPAWNNGLTRETDERVDKFAKSMSGPANHFFGRRHTQETIDRIADIKRLDWETVTARVRARQPDLCVISKKSEYQTQDTLLRIHCAECGSEFESSLFNLTRGARCKTCCPFGSTQELELSAFLTSLGVEHEMHDRKMLDGLELDLWIPSKNLAIEHHGLWWHREDKDGMNRQAHQKKFYECEKRGIHLIQIFADEWREKRELIEHMIVSRLGMSSRKLNARSCTIKEIKQQEGSSFLNKYHINGSAGSKVYFGLFHEQELVSVLTLRTPKGYSKTKENQIEVGRMATVTGTVVRGGASKLMKHAQAWAAARGYKSLMTYSDLRFGPGKVYEKCGFSHVKDTQPDYWYSDGARRFARQEFVSTPAESEKEKSERLCVFRVNGAGSRRYEMDMGV